MKSAFFPKWRPRWPPTWMAISLKIPSPTTNYQSWTPWKFFFSKMASKMATNMNGHKSETTISNYQVPKLDSMKSVFCFSKCVQDCRQHLWMAISLKLPTPATNYQSWTPWKVFFFPKWRPRWPPTWIAISLKLPTPATNYQSWTPWKVFFFSKWCPRWPPTSLNGHKSETTKSNLMILVSNPIFWGEQGMQ